jgi:hypothetical protein
MTDREERDRAEILAKLAESREEFRRILDPPPTERGGSSIPGARFGSAGFPRSRTIQMLMSGRGLGTLGAAAAGLLIARPALALRLLRMLPASAVLRTLLMRAFTARAARPRQQQGRGGPPINPE